MVVSRASQEEVWRAESTSRESRCGIKLGNFVGSVVLAGEAHPTLYQKVWKNCKIFTEQDYHIF
jgi:hypothetical protein